MKQNTRAGQYVIVAVLCCAFIAVFLFIRQPRASSATSQSIAQSYPANHGAWVIAPNPYPAHALLHWQQYSYVGSTTSQSTTNQDPSIGQIILEDHWLQTDDSGKVILDHTFNYLPNGQFLQEQYDTPTLSIHVDGVIYATLDNAAASGNYWCVGKSAQQKTWGGMSGFPFFVDSNELQRDHFTVAKAELVTKIPQNDLSIAGLAPTQSYHPPTTVHVWQGIGPQTGTGSGKKQIIFEVDDAGQIIAFHSNALDANGSMTAQQWYSIGEIDSYTSSLAGVPNWVLQQPQAVTKGCQA